MGSSSLWMFVFEVVYDLYTASLRIMVYIFIKFG